MAKQRFIKMFISDIGRIHCLSGNSVKLLLIVAEKMQPDGVFYTRKDIKEAIAKNLSVTVRTVNNLFTEIVKSGLLEKEASNIYVMNPYIFASGDEGIVNLKRINYMKIRYGDKGREFELGEET